MAVKLLYYFVFIFLGIMTFLLFQNPYNVQKHRTTQKEANMEVIDAKNYSITKDGVTAITSAKKVLRFATHDEFYDVDVLREPKPKVLENLKADKGTLVNNNLKLVGNVRYNNSDGVKFSSQEAQYNLKSKVFKTDLDFILEDNRSVTYGSSLIYETNDGKIYANKIRSIARIEGK